jgi:hypothetical protein
MASRYSGDVAVTLQWSDERQQYLSKVTWPDRSSSSKRKRKRKSRVIYVGAPGVLSEAVDSSAAYDEAAAAAISFASEEDPEVSQLADYTDRGLFIGRKRARRRT